MKLYSYGKINLFLDIEGKLENGYHLIKTVMQSIDIHDEIIIKELSNDEIIIECSDKSIPTDIRNTCFKATKIIKEKYNIRSGILISINKNIPSEAGLAGGSSNSAAVIKGLNKLWSLNMNSNEMIEIALQIGADVPFCIMGGTYLAQGIGEKLTKLDDFIWDNILLVKPEFSMSTSFVYKNLNSLDYNSYKSNNILNLINQNKYNDVALSTANTLEKVVVPLHSEVNSIKSIMLENSAISSIMTGSGSVVFGLFPDSKSMNNAYNILKNTYTHIYKTKTIKYSIDFFD
ncbi:4-diphosphocytidyl-2-C-methyl-D-erythritol kinase [Sedimentibacter acidaminivorans]|uniref:4-diphosphocytidyl-2-C-methyl-D-erythritol kinase n=2 Tax=Sedimentibacter acidaminivorans TaxID=913099 RepID=A0ABS4GAI3_9FIRM|nr:4-diphosphocytidyl-2-C-methyl-D-erythritol kinase [Sedimentibacter acidaminivorans]